jgi:hypothetical protein
MLKFVTGCCAGLALFSAIVSVYRSSLSSHTPFSSDAKKFNEITTIVASSEQPNALVPLQFTAVRSFESHRVMIQHAQHAEALWYVVHERDAAVGAVWGARLFKAAETAGDIPLHKSSAGTGEFVVVRYRDNGDRIFSPARDKPLTDPDTGGILMTSVH